MHITIHRGAHQIGGCITEIASGNAKIIIDFGSNLPGNAAEEFSQAHINEVCQGVNAIFYTHYHGDHVGLMHRIPAEIPQYIGKGAREVLVCKYQALDQQDVKAVVERMRCYDVARPIYVGDKKEICVTPYVVNHSAFDAYLFKIECEGKVILHTGDFRRHGYMGKGLFPLLERHIGTVDILITEGTMLGRGGEQVITERDILQNIKAFLREHKYVFALCSSTDIDRLASFHQACKETNRLFYVDDYQKQVLDIFSAYAGTKAPLFNFDRLFKHVNLRTPNVKRELMRKGFLMPIRMSGAYRVREVQQIYTDQPSWLIYSMWSGYTNLAKPYGNAQVAEIRSLFDGRIMDGTRDGFHTSGHADVETLQQVCATVKPAMGVIPIHKEAGTHYEALPGVKPYRIFTEGVTQIENTTISIR